MDDLDRLLTEAMRAAAVRAPADDGLLSAVHHRSGRCRRQRIATALSAAAAVLAVGAPAAAVLVTGTHRAGPPVALPAAGTVRLVYGYTAPAFPYTLPATGGMRAPVARLTDGSLVALFEATEQRHHADVTVTVSSREPAFAGPGTDSAVRVRGHAGTLRTVDAQPARQFILSWPEAPGRWIQLATDDTYTTQQVVGLADALVPAAVPVLPPFRLDLSPAGLVPETVTESTMTFRAPAAEAAGELRTVLRKRRPLDTTNQLVGRYPALLTHHAGGGATLEVDVTDWAATLEVTVGPALAMTDDDLLRFAAGVHVLDRSDPQ
jgi:hypothetical protein